MQCDDAIDKEYGSKISDPLAQRVEGKMADKVNIRESQREILESSNTLKLHEAKYPTYKQGDLEPTQ